MALLSWRADYEVGVATIDTEHRYLFELINEFHDRSAGGETRVAVLQVLSKLVGYAEEHFQHEEALMFEHAYPQLERQRDSHETLFASLFELNERLSKGDADIDFQTMRFLKGWLVDHILKEDMDIGVFLRRQAALAEKAALEQAQKEAQENAAAEATPNADQEKAGATQKSAARDESDD